MRSATSPQLLQHTFHGTLQPSTNATRLNAAKDRIVNTEERSDYVLQLRCMPNLFFLFFFSNWVPVCAGHQQTVWFCVHVNRDFDFPSNQSKIVAIFHTDVNIILKTFKAGVVTTIKKSLPKITVEEEFSPSYNIRSEPKIDSSQPRQTNNK